MKTHNRTDRIIEKDEINSQPNFDDFKYKYMFSFLCDVIPDRKNERLLIKNEDARKVARPGVLYVFVVDNKLIKVGSSTTSFRERVQSYNCGKEKYRRKHGTCSTTNYLALQTFLRWNQPVKVYAFFPKEIEIYVLGEKQKIATPAKNFEKKILTELKEEGKLPILCTQK